MMKKEEVRPGLKPLTLILDFDLTLTLKHTFSSNSLHDQQGRPVECPDFSSSITDNKVFGNLRNPYTMRLLIEWYVKNQNTVIIISKHDNEAWIKRNIQLLMGNHPCVEKIKIIPLQIDPYDELYSGSKPAAAQQEAPAGNKLIVVDDELSELEQFKTLTANVIQVTSNDDSYLNKIQEQSVSEPHRKDLLKKSFALARYKDARETTTSSEYYYGFFSKMFRGHSKTEKFAAVDALIESLNDENKSLDSKYISALTQGKLGNVVKELGINLDNFVRRTGVSQKHA